MPRKTEERHACERLVSGAVVDFLATLTSDGIIDSREGKRALDAWAKRRGISAKRADVQFWDERIREDNPLSAKPRRLPATVGSNGPRPNMRAAAR